MPQRFLFFKIKGLAKYIKNVKGNALSIVLGLSKSSQDLSRLVAPDSLALNITPVINLFERRADQISVSNDQHEYRVHVNKTKPLDFEVYSVDEVTGLSAGSNYKQEFQPFYRDRAQQNNKHSFFSLRRRSRALTSSERQNGAVSKYRGAEILLSVVDGQNAPIHADVDALSIKVTCSNRHLPLNMPLRGAETDLIPDGGSGLTSIRWVLPPTNPTDSLTDLNGNWGLINHLSVNYLSLVDSEDGQATALKDLLRIYFNRRSEEGNEWIRGIERISSNPVVERHRGPGPITYVRGLQVDIFLDEYSFGGANAFLFGAVIARFLSYHTSINSFIKTNIHSSSRGLIMHWSGARGSKFIA